MKYILEHLYCQAVCYAFNEAEGEMDKEKLNAKILSADILNRAIAVIAFKIGLLEMKKFVWTHGILDAIREYRKFDPRNNPDMEDLFIAIVKKEFVLWVERGAQD